MIKVYHICTRTMWARIAQSVWRLATGWTVRASNPDFPHPSRPALGPAQPHIQLVPGLSQGVRRPRHGDDHPHPSSAKVKETVELYLYSPSGPLWPVLGLTLPLSVHVQQKFLWLPRHVTRVQAVWSGSKFPASTFMTQVKAQ